MAKPIRLPIVIRVDDNDEYEIGTIEADTWPVARSEIANALREAATAIEAEGEVDTDE